MPSLITVRKMSVKEHFRTGSTVVTFTLLGIIIYVQYKYILIYMFICKYMFLKYVHIVPWQK
jgi:hypothetical protein